MAYGIAVRRHQMPSLKVHCAVINDPLLDALDELIDLLHRISCVQADSDTLRPSRNGGCNNWADDEAC